MGIETVDGITGWVEQFPIHFEIEDHLLPLDIFIRTASSVAHIASNLNEELFRGQVTYRVLVLPAQDGSFKSKLAIFVGAVGLVAWNAIESDVGKAFVEGLTGHKPEYWSFIAGQEAAEIPALIRHGIDIISKQEDFKSPN